MKKLYTALVLTLFVLPLFAQNNPSYVPKDGLVGYWPFNGNANDESGNGNHGTVNGAKLTTDRFGNANKAYSFISGTTINVAHNPDLNIDKNYCISVWYNIAKDNYPANDILIKGPNDYSGNAFYLRQHANSFQTPTLVFRIGATIPYSELNTTNRKINQWYNVTINTINSKSFMYIDNILVDSVNIPHIENLINNISNLYIGGGYYPFDGVIDDIAIYKRSLSEQEIAQLYAGCTKETATSSNFNTLMYTTNAPVNLIASPTGGTFSGNGVTNNAFNPSKAKLGKNTVKYNFKNSTGCSDSSNFAMILVDTLGNKCSTYDTLKIKVKLTTGIKSGQQTSMNVYPNPTSDKLIIETNDLQALSGYKYKIVDITGQELYNALATSEKTEISLTSIGAKGIYILHIVDDKGVSIENKKIVLE
jgi:hypothetical protein